jgi:hypothetical protein
MGLFNLVFFGSKSFGVFFFFLNEKQLLHNNVLIHQLEY